MKKEAMRMERVTYIHEDMTLLDSFNFQLFQGEIMGLMPMDSIGLDAFIQLAQHNHPIFYGYVYINEELVNSCLADVNTENNVFYISDESNLVSTLKAEDNIFTLRRGFRGIYIKNKILEQQLNLIIHELNLEIDITKTLDEMTVFEQFVIEIIKAVISKATVIILRSIGSLLSDWDLRKLLKLIKYYQSQGFSFVYITVDQKELAMCCDRVSFMSEGRIKKVLTKDEFSIDHITQIAPSSFQNKWKLASSPDASMEAACVCEFQHVHFRSVKNLTFQVKQGECFVIADITNKIHDDVVELVLGRKPYMGKVVLGNDKRGRMRKRAVSILLENPLQSMLYPEMSYASNLCINIDHKIARVWRKKNLRDSIAMEMSEEEPIDPDTVVKHLSIRQRYQLLYSRVLLQHPDVVFCINPFLNVDIDIMNYIQKWIQRLLQKKITVVIITVNYQPLLPLTDRLMLIGDKTENIIFEKEEVQGMLE